MKMKLVLVSIFLFVAVIGLTGCGKDNKNPIVGKWAHGSYVYTFNNDGTCSYDAAGTLMKCTYKTKGDNLSITYDGSTAAFETTYSIDGNKLNVRDSFGSDTIYTKK